jgi:hypothetical protein
MSARPGGERPGDRDRRAGTGKIFLDETQLRALEPSCPAEE